MEKEKIIYLTIVKSYSSSATEYTSKYKFEGVSNLLMFLNESRENDDEIFNGLTYNDPGDETWQLSIGEDTAQPLHKYTFTIKTWRDINLVIQGIFIAASYDWLGGKTHA